MGFHTFKIYSQVRYGRGTTSQHLFFKTYSQDKHIIEYLWIVFVTSHSLPSLLNFVLLYSNIIPAFALAFNTGATLKQRKLRFANFCIKQTNYASSHSSLSLINFTLHCLNTVPAPTVAFLHIKSLLSIFDEIVTYIVLTRYHSLFSKKVKNKTHTFYPKEETQLDTATLLAPITSNIFGDYWLSLF